MEMIRIYRSLAWKPKGKKAVASMWCKWEDDIKADRKETVVKINPYV
jgi:hypothetical protein